MISTFKRALYLESNKPIYSFFWYLSEGFRGKIIQENYFLRSLLRDFHNDVSYSSDFNQHNPYLKCLERFNSIYFMPVEKTGEFWIIFRVQKTRNVADCPMI